MSTAPTTTETTPNRTQEPPMTTTPTLPTKGARAADLRPGRVLVNRRTNEAVDVMSVTLLEADPARGLVAKVKVQIDTDRYLYLNPTAVVQVAR